jgi:hypothetical protein
MTLPATPVFDTSVRLPTGELDENRAIECIAALISKLRARLEKQHSREWLETELRKGLREGRLTLTNSAIRAADAGDEIADAALRTVFAEMAGSKLPEQEPGHFQVWAYGRRAVLRAPHKRRQGHRWHDDWVRNIQICNLIYFVSRELDVQASRNRAEGPASRAPSGVSLVVAALARNNIHLNEASVQENIWFGLPGELVRDIAPTLPPNDLAVP